ncbi:MAG: hypothetical protein KOO60_12520 [Gemmatimonadales bacterium]|nr:hypothetical protein [Gemmatimonadales bacterium]
MKTMISICVLLLLALFGLWGCENEISNRLPTDVDGPDGTIVVTEVTCLSCHSSEALLKETLGVVATAKVAVPFKDDG